MNPLPADLETLIPRIAELRAEGSGWLPIARELGYDVAEIKSICAETGDFYTRLLRQSYLNVIREGMAESVYTFRKQMRTATDADARRGAEGMSRIGLAFDRQRLAEKRLRLQYAPSPAAAPRARAAKEPQTPDELVDQAMPDTPLGHEVREIYREGVEMRLAREEADRRFPPEKYKEWEDERFRAMAHVRGFAIPGEEIPWYNRPDYVPKGEVSPWLAQPWTYLDFQPGAAGPEPQSREGEDPPGDDCGGTPVPRDPTPPANPGGAGCAVPGTASDSPARGDEPAAEAPGVKKRERIWGIPLEEREAAPRCEALPLVAELVVLVLALLGLMAKAVCRAFAPGAFAPRSAGVSPARRSHGGSALEDSLDPPYRSAHPPRRSERGWRRSAIHRTALRRSRTRWTQRTSACRWNEWAMASERSPRLRRGRRGAADYVRWRHPPRGATSVRGWFPPLPRP